MFLLVIIKDLYVPPQTKTYYMMTKSLSHGFLNFHIIFMHHDWLSPTSPFIMYSTSVIFKCSSLRVSCHSMAPSLFFTLFNNYNSPSPLHITKGHDKGLSLKLEPAWSWPSRCLDGVNNKLQLFVFLCILADGSENVTVTEP